MSQWPQETSMKLIRSLYGQVTGAKCTYSTLQILPTAPDGEILAHESPESDTLDLAVSKKTYLLIFAKAHAILDSLGYKHDLKLISTHQLWTLYFATSSILLTTNEHSTAWRLHCDVFLELHRQGEDMLRKELDYCTFLATSRLKRVNKSSILFTWIRRLSVLFVEDTETLKLLIRRLLRSLEVHFANYCVGFSLQWFIRVFHAKQNDELFQYLGEHLRSACRSHLSDVTLWETYSLWLHVDSDTFAVDLFNEDALFWREHKFQVDSLNVPPITLGNDEAVYTDLGWLLKVQCSFLTPYLKLYKAAISKSRFISEIKLVYEKTNGERLGANRETSSDAISSPSAFEETMSRFLEKTSKEENN